VSEAPQTRLPVANEAQVAQAILEARVVGQRAGLDAPSVARLSTAVSELVRNILKYAGKGELRLRRVERGRQIGVEAVAFDRGPGIADIDAALKDHFSTGGTLGLGLPGVRRMVDEFEIASALGQGTTVTVRLWAR